MFAIIITILFILLIWGIMIGFVVMYCRKDPKDSDDKDEELDG